MPKFLIQQGIRLELKKTIIVVLRDMKVGDLPDYLQLLFDNGLQIVDLVDYIN